MAYSTFVGNDVGQFGYGRNAGKENAQNNVNGSLQDLNPNSKEEEIRRQQEGTNNGKGYSNPGSADYGGTPDAAAYYKKMAQQGGAANDAQQANNSSALGRSLAAAGSYRGPMAKENQDLANREAATRREQTGMLDLSRGAALGLAPSEAAGRTDIGFNDIMGARAGAVGGARGLSALNGAQGGSGVGSAGLNMASAGGMARSKEIENSIGTYGGQAGQVRGQDIGRLAGSNQNNLFNQKLNDDWRVGNANLAAQQAGLSNAYGASDQAWFGESMRPEDKQFQYDQEMAAILAGQKGDEAGAQIARNRESRENTRQTVNGVGTGVLTAVGSIYGGPVGGAAGGMAGSAAGGATSGLWKNNG